MNYTNQKQAGVNYNTLMQNPDRVECALKQAEDQPMCSPIEERAMQLEKELAMINDAVACLAGRIDKVMCPVPEQDCKLGGTSTSQPPQSAMTRAFDYAINSIAQQRMELLRMAERVEL